MESSEQKTTITSEDYPEYHEKISTCQLPEEKIRVSLDFMRSAISQDAAPRFRDFWDIRKMCLPLFKENLNPVMRSKLWAEFVEISNEARRLKDILDEQSSFASEQIDLALKAVEEDVNNYETILSSLNDIEFERCEAIKDRIAYYNTIQKELSLLNTLASRIHSLRKEILKTHMRVRDKNKFFKRISVIGDIIFPKRKELIKAVSDGFIKDVEAFIESHFKGEEIIGAPFYILREEIKSLQSIGKKLTLNTRSFMHTREKLSHCWDIVKKQEKERKKEISSKKQSHSENREEADKRISALEKEVEGLSDKEVLKAWNELSDWMRNTDLAREDVKVLRSKLNEMKPAVERATSSSSSRSSSPQKVDVIAVMSAKIESLVKETEEKSIEELSAGYTKLEDEISGLSLSNSDKDLLKVQLAPLKDLVEMKSEEAILAKSEDEMTALQKYKSILEQKKERRSKIKRDLESYRKNFGGSGFDFEMGFKYQEMIEEEKKRLEEMDAKILDLKRKILEFEGS